MVKIIVNTSLEDHTQQILKLVRDYLTSLVETGIEELNIDISENFDSIEECVNYFTDLYHTRFAKRKGRIYLTFEEDNLVGMASLMEITTDSVELKRNYVIPSFRRKGIGRALVTKLLKDAKDLGYSTIEFDFPNFTQNAGDFYRSFGFEIFSPIEPDHPFGDSVTYMKLIL